jgi:hypothetical protein
MDKTALKQLLSKLSFAEENLPQATLEQPSLFLDAARYRVQKLRLKIQAKSSYETVWAKSANEIRTKMSGTKLTKDYIENLVITRPPVIAAKKTLDEAMVSDEWAQLLLEAFRMRSHACKGMVDILRAETASDFRQELQGKQKKELDALVEEVEKRFNE